ncbi:MAG: hypothetical protein OXC30_03095 [Alphaproteobacteria bacterium]|nr:hypothetical protein [Alphaproteobacteria bacterium]
MHNIMLVPILIMLQMQSVYASSEALDSVNDKRLIFVKSSLLLCNLEDKLIGCLRYIQRNSCLRVGLNEITTQRINAIKGQNDRVDHFLAVRENMFREAKRVLPLFEEAFEGRKTAFSALPESLRYDPCLSADYEKRAPATVYKSMEDASVTML